MAGHRAAGLRRIVVLLRSLGITSAAIAACWQLPPHASTSSAGLMALAAVAIVGAAIALLTRPGRLSGLPAGPLRRGVALRRKSWGAAFQRQLDPDAAGRVRPRAPSTAPAAA